MFRFGLRTYLTFLDIFVDILFHIRPREESFDLVVCGCYATVASQTT
jgi:hypothetical protein